MTDDLQRSSNVERIETDIARTRQRMGDTLEELGARLLGCSEAREGQPGAAGLAKHSHPTPRLLRHSSNYCSDRVYG